MCLRDNVIFVAHPTTSSIHRKVLHAARTKPFSLASGHVDRNSSVLVERNAPLCDEATRNIDTLAAYEYNSSLLARAAELLRACAWTTRTVEQAHGSCGVLHRLHKQYNRRTVAMRAMLHQTLALLQPAEGEARTARIQQRSHVLTNINQSDRITGRNAFFTALLRSAKQVVARDTKLASDLRQRIMSEHAVLCGALTDEEKSTDDNMALAKQAEVRDAVHDQFKHFREQAHTEHARAHTERAELGTLSRVSLAHFSINDLHSLKERSGPTHFLPSAVRQALAASWQSSFPRPIHVIDTV